MIGRFLKGLPVVAVALVVTAGAAWAGKSNDTLVWSTDREVAKGLTVFSIARMKIRNL